MLLDSGKKKEGGLVLRSCFILFGLKLFTVCFALYVIYLFLIPYLYIIMYIYCSLHKHSSVRTNQTIFFFLYLICWSFMTINKHKHKLRLCCTRTNQRILFDLFKENWCIKRQIFTRNIVLKLKTNVSWIIFWKSWMSIEV